MAKKVKKGNGKEPYVFYRHESFKHNPTIITLNSESLKSGEVLSINLYHPIVKEQKELTIKVDKRMTRKSVIAKFNKFFKDNDYPAIMK